MMTEDLKAALAREAEEAEAFADAVERGEVEPPPYQRARSMSRTASAVYSLRLPEARMAELRRVAADLGQAPTVLMREWVLDRLDEALRLSEQTGAGNVTPLRRAGVGQVRLGSRRGSQESTDYDDHLVSRVSHG